MLRSIILGVFARADCRHISLWIAVEKVHEAQSISVKKPNLASAHAWL